jgi:hypothetical protein
LEILAIIASKLDKAFLSGDSSKLHTVIDLVFKPDQILTEEEEVALLKWIKSEIKPERTYVCCNRTWKDGENFKAFLHLHEFNPQCESYKLLLKKLKVG